MNDLIVEFLKKFPFSLRSFGVPQLTGRYPKKYITYRYVNSWMFFGGISFSG
jgi:hypothetical protein